MVMRTITLVLALSLSIGGAVLAQPQPATPPAAPAATAQPAPPPGIAAARVEPPPRGEATAADHQQALRIVAWFVGIFALVSFAVLVMLACSVRKSFYADANKEGNGEWRYQLMQLPLGVPEGSIRALLSIFVIVFGLMVLVLQNRLGLQNVEAISGFIGIVITFYFTARTGDQAQKAVDAAKAAVTNANEAVARAAADTQTQLNRATTELAGAAIRAANPAPVPAVVVAPVGVETAAGLAPLQATLRDLRARLSAVRQVAAAASSLGVGGDLVEGAGRTIETADGLLRTIEPLLSGTPSTDAIGAILDTAGKTLPVLENAGLPGAFADVLASLRGAVQFAGPIVAGIPGGPIGIAGGVILAGVKLAQDNQRFEALKTALLRKPFNPVLLPDSAILGNAATAALGMSRHLSTLLGDQPPAVATSLMRELLRRSPAGGPVPAVEIADSLLKDGLNAEGTIIPFAGRVATRDELVQALEEYRSNVVFQAARSQLEGSVDMPPVDGAPGAAIDLRQLVDAAAALSGTPAGASQIERLVYLAEALGKLPNESGAVTTLVVDALNAAQKLLPQRVTQQENS
ncbi:hypothetical protein [Roseococcus sp. YIM B11640]|uniref:hypothetical protein n=1 Tax=Roseococcus sp. YIM B11640 TaxID=3133973 RepID=UPI003C7CB975